MFNIKAFKAMENNQSHLLCLFQHGSPYCMLGWKKYRLFNNDINTCLNEFKKEFEIKVYVYEYEVIHIEGLFLWGFSFAQDNLAKRDELSDILIFKLTNVYKAYFSIEGDLFLHNHSENFNNSLNPDLMAVYVEMVMSFGVDAKLKYSPPKNKSYTKDDFDISVLNKPIKVSKFKETINDYLAMNSTESLIYRLSPDGYFSNKYRSNKYLREEFVPLLKFIKNKGISESAYVELGVQDENYDAKIIDGENELIIEITLGAPKNDYLYQTVTQSNGISVLPLKVLAHLKKEIDSLAERIILSIEKKHNKNYGDGRVLLVVVQPEYTYQNETDVIDELLKEVRSSVSLGDFKEIVLLFESTLHVL